MCVIYSLDTLREKTHSNAQNKFLHIPPTPSMYTHEIPREEKGRKIFSPYTFTLQECSWPFTRTVCKKLLSKILHMHIDFQEVYSFCLLVGWRTKKQNLGGSQVSKLIRAYSWGHCSLNKLLCAMALSCVATSSTNLHSI